MKENKDIKTNIINNNKLLKYLPYMSGTIYIMLCFVEHIYNIGYCRYFNIPLEYVSFTLSNGALIMVCKYFVMTLYLFICYFGLCIINEISSNVNPILYKIISCVCSYIFIFLITILSLVLYFKITFNYKVNDLTYYL